MTTPDRLVDAIRRGALTPGLWRATLSALPPPRLLRTAEMLYGIPGGSAAAAALVGHAAYHRRDYALAIDALAAADWTGPGARENLFALAHAFAAQGRAKEADGAASKLAGLGGAKPEAAWARALAALAAGAHADALEALEPIADSGSGLPFCIARDEVDWLIEFLAEGLGRRQARATKFRNCLSNRWASSHRSADADIVFGILDYKSSDLRGSGRNVDDWIQTVAALRHIVRFADASWTADDLELRHTMARLESTWQAHERRPAQRTRIHIAVVDRDEPWSAAHIHGNREVWLIVNGWFMHASFDVVRGLPFPDNVHPIFVGFHLAVADHLDDRLVQYLKLHEPIGCRDRATVWWLLNRGIDAFFSGCLTLTLPGGTDPDARNGRIAVDLPSGADGGNAARATHQAPPDLRISRAVDQALDLLDRYAAAEEVTTTRLHAYLACRALDTPVTLEARVTGERRFDGLDDLTPEQVASLRGRLTRSMDAILGWIVSHASRKDVAMLWRGINAPFVEEAKAALRSAARDAPAAAGEPAPQHTVKRKRKSSRKQAPVTIALAFDGTYAPHVPPLLRSCAARATVPLEFVFLVRDIDDLALQRLGAAIAGLDTRIVRTDQAEEDRHGSAQAGARLPPTLDRLRLPELLPDRDRIVSLDIDTVCLGDVAELVAGEISVLGIGARADPNTHADILAKLFDLPANRGSPAQAKDMRRFAAANLDLWAPSLESGVLVLSLEALRRNDFTARTTALVGQFGVPAVVAINAFAGGRFAPLPKAWNTMPYYEWPEDPKLVHFRGPLKPWTAGRSPRFAEHWRAHVHAAPAPAPGLPDTAGTTVAR